MRLWSKNQERIFFDYSKNYASYDELFYKIADDKYVTYMSKKYSSVKSNLHIRDILTKKYTEKWVCDLFEELLENTDLHVIQQARIPAIGISHKYPADIVIASENKKVLMPDEVKVIFDVEMSIVWNWQYDSATGVISEIGDYRTHQGKPSFTRSDSVLSAVGKCIDIRLSDFKSSKIPLIVLGNTPLSNGFCRKADFLKLAGIIQGFWSLNPFPLNHGNTKKHSSKNAFIRFDNSEELNMSLNQLFKHEINFFSGMENLEKIGQLIEIANKESTFENKGLKFLNLLKRS